MDFFLFGPALDLGFAPESRGLIRILFGIDYFYWFMGSGVGSALTIFVNQKPSTEIGGDAGIERTVRTEKDIYEIHGILPFGKLRASSRFALLVAGPGIAPGLEDYEPSVRLYTTPHVFC